MRLMTQLSNGRFLIGTRFCLNFVRTILTLSLHVPFRRIGTYDNHASGARTYGTNIQSVGTEVDKFCYSLEDVLCDSNLSVLSPSQFEAKIASNYHHVVS